VEDRFTTSIASAVSPGISGAEAGGTGGTGDGRPRASRTASVATSSGIDSATVNISHSWSRARAA
jgi:hypothetical protein